MDNLLDDIAQELAEANEPIEWYDWPWIPVAYAVYFLGSLLTWPIRKIFYKPNTASSSHSNPQSAPTP